MIQECKIPSAKPILMDFAFVTVAKHPKGVASGKSLGEGTEQLRTKFMKTVGIIAEYNPFHKGHAYQLRKAKELSGADFAVVVMSGDFVQRGGPALTDKYLRAEMALRSGADLVLELPTVYATGSAETFARGAVSVLEELGVIDILCFGSEAGELSELLPYAWLFEKEPPLYRACLQAYLKQGFSFPAARSRAAEEYRNSTERILPCSADDADCRMTASVLDSPNNILGVEYLRALLHKESRIQPLTLKREAAGYHALTLDTSMASASAIRNALSDAKTSDKFSLDPAVASKLPEASAELLTEALQRGELLFPDDFSTQLFYRLLAASEAELAAIQDVGEELAARIYHNRFAFTTAEEFTDRIKTRQVTHTRVTRALCHILLGFSQKDLEEKKAADYPVYLRALGFRKSAGELLSAIKRESASPLLVKTADARKRLTAEQYALFEQDMAAAHLYESAKTLKTGRPMRHEYTRSPVILP